MVELKLPSLADFRKYVRVQSQAHYNMLDPRAVAATGLSPTRFAAVRDNYAALAAKYPKVVGGGEEP